jgi:hypothetical protein
MLRIALGRVRDLMALRLPTEPTNGTAVVRQGLDQFSVQDNSIEYDSDMRAAAGPPRIDHFHPVYHLDAEAVVGGRNLAATELTSYRYLVQEGAGKLSMAEIRVDATHNATGMTMRSYGPYAEAIIGGLAQVERLPAIATGSYELRVLQCPEIFLVALWLKGDQGVPDILYPLTPAPQGFQPERPYAADEFLTVARSLIQALIAAHASP